MPLPSGSVAPAESVTRWPSASTRALISFALPVQGVRQGRRGARRGRGPSAEAGAAGRICPEAVGRAALNPVLLA